MNTNQKLFKVCGFNYKNGGLTEVGTHFFNREAITLKDNMGWKDAKALMGTTKGLFIVPQARLVEHPVEMSVEAPEAVVE